MRTLLLIAGLLVIWGGLVLGNVALMHWTADAYLERMESNYLINNYDGRLLLSQGEYRQFKQDLLDPEVVIRHLDVYSSEDTLIIYDISAPAEYDIYALDEAQSQHWRYGQGRIADYGLISAIIIVCVVCGSFLSFCLYGLIKRRW